MLKMKAYAKINLFLNVVGLRPDGYHDLEMVNAKITLADDLRFYETLDIKPVTICSNDAFLENDSNLLNRVANFMIEHYARGKSIKIEIDKQIPPGAGLAGNSTDAAAIIKGMNQLFNLNLSKEQMKHIAIRFGADIPYCLQDEPALVKGIGEIIEPLDFPFSNLSILVLKPKAFVRTEEVFTLGDEIGFSNHDVTPMLKAIKDNNIEKFIKTMKNSLESITFQLSPETAEAKQMLIDYFGEDGIVMSGSGSTIIKIVRENNDKINTFIRQHAEKYQFYQTNIVNNE